MYVGFTQDCGTKNSEGSEVLQRSLTTPNRSHPEPPDHIQPSVFKHFSAREKSSTLDQVREGLAFSFLIKFKSPHLYNCLTFKKTLNNHWVFGVTGNPGSATGNVQSACSVITYR